jgi:hypothetical protein
MSTRFMASSAQRRSDADGAMRLKCDVRPKALQQPPIGMAGWGGLNLNQRTLPARRRPRAPACTGRAALPGGGPHATARGG